MKIRKTVLGMALVTALMGQGVAQAELYMGLGIGQSMVDISGSDIDALAAADGLTTTTSVDDNDTAWKLFGGWRMTDNFAIEATYMDYGTISSDSIVTAPAAGSINIDVDTTAWIFDVVGILPVNDQFELFAKLGVAVWDLEGSISAAASGLSFTDSADDDGSDLHVGFGANYAFTDTIALRAEWERVNGDEDLDAWLISAQYSFK